MLSIDKYIERIADHATNIGKLIIFMVRGLDVRHTDPASNNPTA
jgi:phosphate transport system protein